MGMFDLAAHPVGIKFWTGIWKANKDLPYSQIHAKFESYYTHMMHRNFGRYFYSHRAGPAGALAPLIVFGIGFKISAMFYGTLRDINGATEAAAAYGQGGFKCNPVPK
mmetsp:Transcript_134737/g.237571  ORF Transcript_134737/g.237571 Transcript_134737/m.237571 type:complete len:108 (+) Transcript_134737:82-405(+)